MKKWTLVTGGAKGLGAAIAQTLASQGMPLLIHYRTSKLEAENVAEICRQCGVDAEIIYGDFSSPESTSQFIKTCTLQFPEVKNLINNVGNYLIKSATKTTPEEWNHLFQTNLNAPFALCQAFLPSIISSQGNIINIGVVGANNIHADTQRSAYLTTKMSLWMLTKSLARELAESNVRVNMISPGFIENAVDIQSVSRLPMGRPASFDEVTRVATFLIDPKNSYITGQNIEVGGGIGLIH
ncbi:MAG: SDR family oxidoreductase [Parachlamydiaceae bacterium]